MTKLQKEVFGKVLAAKREWFRAEGSGQRVTLASLYRGAILERRAWRTGKCEADNAYEYRVHPRVLNHLGKAPVEQEAQLKCDGCSRGHELGTMVEPCEQHGCECWCNR